MNTQHTLASTPWIAATRFVVKAGGWVNILLLLGWGLGLWLMSLASWEEKSIPPVLLIPALCLMFWAMLAGSRMIATGIESHQLGLPNAFRQTLRHLLTAVFLTIGLPILLLQISGFASDFALAGYVLTIGLMMGLLWASMPPWMMWGMIALNGLWIFADTLPSHLPPLPQLLPGLVLVLLALNLLCWHNMLKVNPTANTWRKPLALQLSMGSGYSLAKAQQDQWNAQLFHQMVPTLHTARRDPNAALAMALGPGFFRPTSRSILNSLIYVLPATLAWVWLAQTKEFSDTFLKFAPLLLWSVTLAPLTRLSALVNTPGLGLHEPALLPKLPRDAANAFTQLFARQQLIRFLPAFGLTLLFLLWLQAPFSQMLTVFWFSVVGVVWNTVVASLMLNWPKRRILSGSVFVIVVLYMATTPVLMEQSQSLSEKTLLWSIPIIVSAFAAALLQQRLHKRPHLWLQN